MQATDDALPRSLPRCAWASGPDARMREYHDREWGTPSRDERHLFEMLILEGFQAGLSWKTILDKREAFRRAFSGFDPARVAAFTDDDAQRIMADPGIVRNRLKIRAAVLNAQIFLEIQKEFGSFAAYLDAFVKMYPPSLAPAPVPVTTELGDALSRDLVRRGMRFAGPVVICSFLHAVGVLFGHEPGCFRATTNEGEQPWTSDP
ncbi:MAG TPA: DNA-3-methyladenine glycosylase I [Candidatus Limnocylindria bacterium]|nr:DNA-3-methyladenine glycosylase I [Candidatus Limnocylindria bacterium]